MYTTSKNEPIHNFGVAMMNQLDTVSAHQVRLRHSAKLQRPRVILRGFQSPVEDQRRQVRHLRRSLGFAPGELTERERERGQWETGMGGTAGPTGASSRLTQPMPNPALLRRPGRLRPLLPSADRVLNLRAKLFLPPHRPKESAVKRGERQICVV